MECKCKSWKQGNAQLMSFTTLAATHGMEYTAKKLRYCPWCGKKLVKEKKKVFKNMNEVLKTYFPNRDLKSLEEKSENPYKF